MFTPPRQWAHTFRDDPERVLVLIDLSNAFNCVSRGAVLLGVHIPIFLGWRLGLTLANATTSIFLLAAHWSAVREAIQQRDPLGPSLFALALHPCVTAAARASESRFPGDLDYNSFDDYGVIAGRSPVVQQTLAALEERLLEIGLNIARHKTEVVPGLHVRSKISPLVTVEGFARVTDGNIKLLGAAIGSRSWCEAMLKRRVTKARILLDACWSLPGHTRCA